MPDSFSPSSWGSALYDERDLDALLSGETADIAPPLRQVADALAALCAAPSSAELSGEAAAMAEFRALGLVQAAHTLELPVTPPGAAPRHRARHRGRRRARRVSMRAGALMGAAAAAVIIMVIAFSGNLPGPIKNLTRLTTATPSSSASAQHDSGSSSALSRGAAAEPASHPATPRPASSPQKPQPGPLCRNYFAYFASRKHPQTRDKLPAEIARYEEKISELAGGSQLVHTYCGPYVRDMFPHGIPWFFPPFPDLRHGQGNFGPESGNQGTSGQNGNGNGTKAGSPSGRL